MEYTQLRECIAWQFNAPQTSALIQAQKLISPPANAIKTVFHLWPPSADRALFSPTFNWHLNALSVRNISTYIHIHIHTFLFSHSS